MLQQPALLSVTLPASRPIAGATSSGAANFLLCLTSVILRLEETKTSPDSRNFVLVALGPLFWGPLESLVRHGRSQVVEVDGDVVSRFSAINNDKRASIFNVQSPLLPPSKRHIIERSFHGRGVRNVGRHGWAKPWILDRSVGEALQLPLAARHGAKRLPVEIAWPRHESFRSQARRLISARASSVLGGAYQAKQHICTTRGPNFVKSPRAFAKTRLALA